MKKFTLVVLGYNNNQPFERYGTSWFNEDGMMKIVGEVNNEITVTFQSPLNKTILLSVINYEIS